MTFDRVIFRVTNGHPGLGGVRCPGVCRLLYAEGTRSRTGRLQPFLKAVARYLDVPDLRVVPMASWGSERIMPIGGEQITPAPMHLHIAPSFAVAECDGVRGALSRGWTAIAEHLPDSHAPLPDTEPLR